ncbi:hypothetical protein [Orbus mooreae]|uniref:hypothetical protein n=1 Tax=Orbus mooreae TaxID=3074107 RepID=UPI00370D5035
MENSLQQQLLTELDNAVNRKKYRYLLIDNLASISELDFIHLDNMTALLGSNAITTVLRPELSHSPEACPQLLTIARPHRALDEKIIHYSVMQATLELLRTKRYICSWFVSEQPAEVVAELLVQVGAFVGQRCQLPFLPIYEPFRFQLLHESNQISALWLPSILNFSDSYCYLDMQGQLKLLKPVESLPTGIELFLSEPAQLYQKNARHLFQFYLSWQRYCQQVGKDTDENTLMKVANAYLAASRQGLTDSRDKSLFTLMSLRYGDLASHYLLQQAIDNAINEPGTLADKFKLVDKSVFLDLSQ